MTELIQGTKEVIVKGKAMIIVTTQSGKTIWVSKSQFSEQAETITYNEYKAGDTFIATRDSNRLNAAGDAPLYLKGATVARLSAATEFVCFGQQRVKKYSAMEILDHLIGKGITPTFSLASA